MPVRQVKGPPGRPWWSAEELDYLHSLVGDYPYELVVYYYQRWATLNGYPARSERGIGQKLRDLPVSRVPVGTYITTGTITGLLSITDTTIDRWVRHGFLKPETFNSHDSRVTGKHPPRRYFQRRHLVQLARDRPELFAGTSKQNLYLLLEDEQLAEQIAANYPKRFGRDRVPVICIETGRRYPSVTDAAKAVYVTKNCVDSAIKRGHRAAGYHWRKAA